MKKTEKILAVIAAREGSKGLPGKNICDCAGKPLIAWTIEAAVASRYIDSVLVSTDAGSIADIAQKYGAWVPFLRSDSLAGDQSSIIDVIKDVLFRLSDLDHGFDYVLLLQPTSPLRTTAHIDQAIDDYFASRLSDDDTLVSVKQIDSKYLWTLGQNETNGYMFNYYGIDLADNSRRQTLPQCYLPNGAIYLARVKDFQGFYSHQTRMFLMDDISSTDIDSQADLDFAAQYLADKMK